MATGTDDAKFNLGMIRDKIQGGTIVGSCETPDSDDFGEYFHGLIVENDGIKYLCWIQCDPEGNGPGFLTIEEHSKL